MRPAAWARLVSRCQVRAAHSASGQNRIPGQSSWSEPRAPKDAGDAADQAAKGDAVVAALHGRVTPMKELEKHKSSGKAPKQPPESRSALSELKPGNDLIADLHARRLLQNITSKEIQQHVEESRTVYCGVDPTAASLHIGNLLPLVTLLRFQAAGHQAIAVIGGATGSVGDPSGRTEERDAMPADTLARNIQSVTAQVRRVFASTTAYLDRKGKGIAAGERKDVKILNNLDWTKDITLLDFLKTVGKNARMGPLLSREAVKTRLNSKEGISFTEFAYQLLQGHDFQHLYNEHDCTIQIGGSDQWGNIVGGIDLIKRQLRMERVVVDDELLKDADLTRGDPSNRRLQARRQMQQDANTAAKDNDVEVIGEEAFGMTLPLLTTSSGEKLGKSMGNSINLDSSPIVLWQYFLRMKDDEVESRLKEFTFFTLEEIQSIMNEHDREPKRRLAQITLANTLTEMIHGEEGVQRARDATRLLYHSEPRELKKAEVLRVFEGDSHLVHLDRKVFKQMTVAKMLVLIGLCKSRVEASRRIDSESVYINERLIKDKTAKFSGSDLRDKALVLVRVGATGRRILCIADHAESDNDDDRELVDENVDTVNVTIGPASEASKQ